MDNSLWDSTENRLSNPVSYKKEFTVLLISDNNRLRTYDIIIELMTGKIILKPLKEKHSKYKFLISDTINILSEDDMKDTTNVHNIKLKIRNTNDDNEWFKRKKYITLHYYPKTVKRYFNICKCFSSCSCHSTYIERSLKQFEMVITDKVFKDIKTELIKKNNLSNNILFNNTTTKKIIWFVEDEAYLSSRDYLKVKHIFDIGEINWDIKYIDEIERVVEKIVIKECSGIVVVDDYTSKNVHVWINTVLGKRIDDSNEFLLHIPIGVIPSEGGEFGGWCKTLAMECNENCTVENCAFMILKGGTKNIDLWEITQGMNPKKKIYCVNYLSWGVNAELTWEENRNYRHRRNCSVNALKCSRICKSCCLYWKVLFPTWHQARFMYWKEEDQPVENDLFNSKGTDNTNINKFLTPNKSKDRISNLYSYRNSTEFDWNDENNSFNINITTSLVSEKRNSAIFGNDEQYPNIIQQLEGDQYNIEEGPFTYFHCSNISYNSSLKNTAEKAISNNGLCDVITLKSNTSSCCHLLRQLNLKEVKDEYFDSENKKRKDKQCQYIKTRFFRWNPLTEIFTPLCIDGVEYNSDVIQVKVLPGVIKVFSLFDNNNKHCIASAY